MFVVLLLPWSFHIVGRQPAFLPMVISAVLLIEMLSTYLLLTRFRDTGDRRVLLTALAYVWSGLLAVAYALSFPELFAFRPPLESWPSATPWLYLSWHVGFPALLALSSLAQDGQIVAVADRRRTAARMLATTAAAAVALIAVIVGVGEHILPTVIVGTDTSRMTFIGGPPSMIIAVAAAVTVSRRSRHRDAVARWSTVTAWSCVADLTLTFASLHRYSLGWFGGRTLTVVSSSFVLFALLSEFTALQRRLIGERGHLQVQARTDPLTGLDNRLSLYELLDGLLQQTVAAHLVLVDLDRFKMVNDSLGHEAGDAVIVETARRLVRLNDDQDLVVRLGGDEFAVVLSGRTDQEAHERADSVVAVLAEPFELMTGGIQSSAFLGASAGLVALHGHSSAGDALRSADLALYQAKETGRGRAVMFDEVLRQRTKGRLGTEAILREALAENTLIAVAQPMVELPSGAVVGHELLLRIETNGSLELPTDLIDVAEETGLIVEIDCIMIAKAAALVAEDEHGTLGLLNVNLSARTLVDPRFANAIAAAAGVAGDRRARLGIELTGRMLADLGLEESDTMAQVRALGVRIGIDNFGAGFSAIACLRRFPLDFLKVDRAFTRDLLVEPTGRAMMGSLLGIARALGLEVVVKGVESQEQTEVLLALGFDCAQGYYFGRPELIRTGSWTAAEPPRVSLDLAVARSL